MDKELKRLQKDQKKSKTNILKLKSIKPNGCQKPGSNEDWDLNMQNGKKQFKEMGKFNSRLLNNADLQSSDEQEGGQQIKGKFLEIENESEDSEELHRRLKAKLSQSDLQKVKIGLKDCKGESGLFNPLKAFDRLNDMQKQLDPDAYQPNIVTEMHAQKMREE